MNRWVEKDKKRRYLYKKYEQKRIVLKSIVTNQSLSEDIRFSAQLELSKLPKNSSRSRIRNRCVVSGRSRGVYRKFKVSRIVLRKLASEGLIPGMVKSSW